MRRNVDVHYLHRMANIVKNSCTGVLSKTDDARDEMVNNIVSVGKIVDISLNIITNAYIEEEMRVYSPVYKVKSALISFTERFSQATNLLLVLALMGLTIGVAGCSCRMCCTSCPVMWNAASSRRSAPCCCCGL